MEKKELKLSRKFTIALPEPPLQQGIIFIKGSNGSGKTTLLRLLSSKFDVPLTNLITDSEKAKRFKEQSTLFFEETMLSHAETLQKNLNYINSFVEIDKELQQKLIKKLNLTESILNRKFKKCSTGEKKKFITVLSLSQINKEIYYLDEPFENIDIASKTNLLEILKNQFTGNKTLFTTTHNEEVLSGLNYITLDLG